MPRTFRFRCTFKCGKCGKSFIKMGSCIPKECAACGARHERFDLVKKTDLKK